MANCLTTCAIDPAPDVRYSNTSDFENATHRHAHGFTKFFRDQVAVDISNPNVYGSTTPGYFSVLHGFAQCF